MPVGYTIPLSRNSLGPGDMRRDISLDKEDGGKYINKPA